MLGINIAVESELMARQSSLVAGRDRKPFFKLGLAVRNFHPGQLPKGIDDMASYFREKNPNWRGGRSVASNGYIIVRVGIDHHLSDVRGYAYEHRLVAEKILERRLRKGEIPHHINGDKTDNSLDNIKVLKNIAHHRLEHRKVGSNLRHPEETNPHITCECGCGGIFLKFDPSGRPRCFISGHNFKSRPVEIGDM